MKKLLSAVIAASILCIPAVSSQSEEKTTQTKQTAQEIIQHAGEKSTEKVRKTEIDKIIKEAVDAVARGNKVLYLLNHGKTEEAKQEIKLLKEKISSIEKKYKLEKLPIDAVVSEITGITDIKEAEKLVKQAKEAVKNNDLITARTILNTLRDEIVIETVYLPIKLYKEAVELTEKLLQEGKIKSAANQLQVALGLIEIETTIIPRSIAVASLLVEEASKIYRKEPDKALKLLNEAKKQIKLARVLGYIKTEDDINPLIKQIETLEQSVREKSGKSEQRFKKLFKSIEEMRERSTTTH